MISFVVFNTKLISCLIKHNHMQVEGIFANTHLINHNVDLYVPFKMLVSLKMMLNNPNSDNGKGKKVALFSFLYS